MTSEQQLDRVLESWLAVGPTELSDRSVAAIVEQLDTVKQRRLFWLPGLGGGIPVTPFVPALGAAAVVVVATALALSFYFNRPAVSGPSVEPRSSFAGTWINTTDADGGTQTMTINVSVAGAVDIKVLDDIASVCSGGPSTMTGSGRLDGSNKLVIPAPVYTCDDGSEAKALSGPPLAEQLRNTTFVYHADSDTLTVGDASGPVWRREGSPNSSPAPAMSSASWPQTNLAAVKQAQAGADAGDANYFWQVDPGLASDDYTVWDRLDRGEVKLVDRFLREVLGWDAYIQNRFEGGADNSLTDQRFLRCAPGRTNPLYPPQPDSGIRGESCAPTLDELTYESVSFDLVQPYLQGPGGIWVVSNWRMAAPFVQADPAVAEAQATDRLEKFMAARIAGRGAEGYVDVYAGWVEPKVPLLYAATSGSPYERFELERVAGPAGPGPMWPYGGFITFSVHLFAADGTVVEQQISSHWDGGRSVGIQGGLALVGTTIENGRPVPMVFAAFDGEVTYSSPSQNSMDIEEPGRQPWDRPDGLIDFTDPAVFWSQCAQGPEPADAAAFAQAVAADPNFVTTAPVVASVAGKKAVAIDVTLSSGGHVCGAYRRDVNRWIHALEPGKRLRLFLVDVPEGMSMRTLAVTVMASEENFERVIEAGNPIVDSIEFHPH